jgi:hypothetical protein
MNDNKQRDKSPKNKKKRRNKEKLTIREIEELMGMNMQVLTKKNGAWKRK